MNSDHLKHAGSKQSNAPSVDTSGKPVDVVARDIVDAGKTRAVDEVITPTSIRTKEQDAEELKKAVVEVERKVADN